jgi:hypothetical protein
MLLVVDRPTYLALLKEDRPVEWATVVFFVVAGLGALGLVLTSRTSVRRRYCYALLGVFCLFVAAEEISWGQRLLGIHSPEFFRRNSDQREINVHNVLQKWSGLTSKLVAALAFLGYGVGLPIVLRSSAVAARMPAAARTLRTLVRRFDVAVPPPALSGGFLLGSILMIDLPTYQEEEVAELLFSLCFVLFMGFEALAAGLEKKEGTGARSVPSVGVS